MNRSTRYLIAAVVVIGVSYGAGFWQEYAKVGEAEAARASCQTGLETLTRTSSHSQGLLDLYRARVELLRANFGNGADFLAKAKTALNADPAASAAIDRALEAARKVDPSAGDLVQQEIAAIESAPASAPATVAATAAPASTPAVVQTAPQTPAQVAPRASPKESPH